MKCHHLQGDKIEATTFWCMRTKLSQRYQEIEERVQHKYLFCIRNPLCITSHCHHHHHHLQRSVLIVIIGYEYEQQNIGTTGLLRSKIMISPPKVLG